MDPDSDSDPTPAPIPFFIDFKDAKKKISKFFSSNLPTEISSSVQKIKIFAKKFCVKILVFRHYFSPLNTFMRKGKDTPLCMLMGLKRRVSAARPKPTSR